MFAKRMGAIHSSGIRKVFDLAAGMINPVNLSIGQPDFSAPDAVKNAMIKAINDNKLAYTQSQGLAELRSEILANLKAKKLNVESVMLTSGVSGGLFLAYSVLLDARDEMIVFDPYFVVYTDLCEFLGAKARIVSTNPDFSIDFDKLEKVVNKKTKALMINSPANPSGYVLARNEVRRLADFARAHDLWVFSDEIYEAFVYEGEHVSIAEYYDKVLVFNGFSKNLAIPGERLGYVAGPASVIDRMIQLQQYTFVCPPSIAQYGVLGNTCVDVSEHIREYASRAELVYETLKPHFRLSKPKGAFYAFPEAPEGVTATDFVTECIRNNVLVIPGSVFSMRDTNFRISFATSKANLVEGLKRLIEVKRKFGN